MLFINGSSVKNPIETSSSANTVIRKSTGLFTPVNMFRLSLLSVSLTQVLNSLRSPKKSDHSAVKFSYELNFRHSRFISHLFTIHSQGLLHFTPHRIHSNHDSWNSFFFLSNHDSQCTKKLDHDHLIEGKYSPSYEKNEISQSRDTIYYIFPLLKENATY